MPDPGASRPRSDRPAGAAAPGIEAVDQAARRLQGRMDPDLLARELISVLEDLLQYEHAAVLLLDESSGELVPFAVSDQGRGRAFPPRDMAYIRSQGPRLDRGITGWVARHGLPIRTGDVEADARYFGIRSSIRSELCVPLASGDRILGVVNVESPVPDRYTELDERVLRIVAAQITVAIENAELLERIRLGEQRLLRLQRMEGLAELAGGAAHDFRNLILVILGSAELARSSLEPDHPAIVDIDAIIDAGRRGQAFTEQLVDLARATRYEPDVADLAEVLQGLEPLLRRTAGAGIGLEIAAAGSTMAAIDRRGLERVLLNLVMNARDASPDGGRITIRAGLAEREVTGGSPGASGEPAPQRARIEVVDEGIGMDDATRRRIFEPFFSTKAADRGSGLGMAIVDATIAQAGGDIEIESAPGRGTTVRLLLRLA